MSDPMSGQISSGQPSAPAGASSNGNAAAAATAANAPGVTRPADQAAAPPPSPSPAPASASAPPEPPKPKIGDTRPAPPPPRQTAGRAARTATAAEPDAASANGAPKPRRRRRGGRGRGGARPTGAPNGEGTDGAASVIGAATAPAASDGAAPAGARRRAPASEGDAPADAAAPAKRTRSRAGAGTAAPRTRSRPATSAATGETAQEIEEAAALAAGRRRRGRERKGRPVGRYLMCVHVQPEATQIAVLEGRSLIEHHVARAQDDANQIDGNIYRGRVKNVLPGMEAAFVDIGTPKNAVLYWGDVQSDRDDSIEREAGATRIEHLLRPGQTIVCQVTKNPIGLKGARLTEEVSLPGRFVVLVPNSSASGISKRLDDPERKRLRKVLDDIRPEGHGLIVRTAAEGVSADELRRDVEQLLAKWDEIEAKARRLPAPALLYSEPHLALRVIREEFTEEHRGVIIDDRELYELVRAYVADIDPALADRVEYYDPEAESLPLFERHHVHEQLHKALDRKVWLPSGGSLIIERTEALTVIDVNTGKNVGSSSLEETVFRNNLEAAEEIARQLRLRDIGGIIVIDFIDMEIKSNRQEVASTLRSALARDKTPTQVFDVSELGLVEMTRKRVGEGLVEALSDTCPTCKGRGLVFQDGLG